MVNDSPNPKNSMPKYFKEMEKHGLKIKVIQQLKKNRPKKMLF
jgi:hypothetical protein